MVHTDLVLPSSVSKTQQVSIRCTHGEAVSYPTALVIMEIDGLQVCVEAALCKSLPVSVLLGTDVPELFTLLSRVRSQEDSGMAVVTRSKLKQQQLEAREEHVRDLQSGARLTSMEEPTAKEKELDTCGVPEAQSYDNFPSTQSIRTHDDCKCSLAFMAFTPRPTLRTSSSLGNE